MGQSTSRNSSPPPSVSPVTLSHRSQPTASPSSSQSSQRDGVEYLDTSGPPSTKTSRRSSVRRSVRDFLRTRTQSDAPSPSSPFRTVPSFRKRWRSAKRFSKSPASLPDLSEALQEGDRCPVATAAAVNAQLLPAADEPPAPSGSSSSPPLQPLPPTACSTTTTSCPPDDLSESETEALSMDGHSTRQDYSKSATSALPTEANCSKIDVVQHQERAQDVQREINDFLLERPRQDSMFIEGSSQDGQISDAPESLPANTSPQPFEADVAAEPVAQTPRHFPPPGTLVVVQGVVNTSDNPATPQASTTSRPLQAHGPPADMSAPTTQSAHRSSSVPRPETQSDERHSTRRRLSAFVPRPSNMLRRQSSTSDSIAASVRASRSSSDISTSGFNASATSASSDDVSGPSSSAHQDQQPAEDIDVHARPLSPGSIDVLGTLLSVAAAATAASLFSPSLGFQANSDPYAPQAGPAISRPMSPTPTAGLSGGQGLGVVPDFSDESSASPPHAASSAPQQREGRDRIRNVWESFRDRLGLNRSSTSPAGPTSAAEDSANLRPSEIMLAEMARALNVGLGLTPEGSNPPSQESNSERLAPPDGSQPTVAPRPAGTSPPEDSFERFLLNLQADLRVALSESGAASSSPSSQDATVGDDQHAPASDVAADADTDSSIPARHESQQASTSNGGDGDSEGLPLLQDGSDSEDEDYDEESIEDRASVRTATPMPSGRDVPNRSDHASPSGLTQEERGDGERRPPGIQLWRLYRFQPIHATQIAGHAATTTPSTAPAFPHAPSPTPHTPPAQADGSNPDPDPLVGPSSPPTSTPTATTSSTSADTVGAESPSSAPPATDPNANMVVPVIVVGLQSVEMGQVHGHAHQNEPDQAPSFDAASDERGGSLYDGRRSSSNSSIIADQTGDATPRGRSWPSRAATALRNLRPGRRNDSRGRQNSERNGSRTFLIYVIGGYYPPNHHMVTGPDNLDSYEALWELAELLGQVKPQVATWEDIEKSDLKTVKFSELEHYEREGRVASSCVDRCLICLDDYQPEDDLRLMRCRHAFHKDCVDKWLQVGRNNCPACRSKGVSTADELVR
ncbi:hypothetical protein BD414DRAFT_487625 [Trametes punicea]|nr:hypothetical protein BD414DRAFT_487625 [Trametes punicea]